MSKLTLDVDKSSSSPLLGTRHTDASPSKRNLLVALLLRLRANQFRMNFLTGSVATAISAVAVLISYPIYLRLFGYHTFGLWIVLSTVLSVAQTTNIGIGPAVTKLVAEEYGRKNLSGVRDYIASSMLLASLTGIAFAIGITLMRGRIADLFGLVDRDRVTAIAYLPAIGLITMYYFFVQILTASLSGLGRMDLSNYCLSLSRLVELSTGLFLVWFGFGLKGLLLAELIPLVSIHILAAVLIRKIVSDPVFRRSHLRQYACAKILRYGTGVFGGSIISVMITPLNKVFISRYVGPAALAVYDMVWSGSITFRSLFEAGTRALIPAASALAAEPRASALDIVRRLHNRTMVAAISLSFPFYVLVFTLTPTLLRLWLRERYVPEVTSAFRICLIGTAISLATASSYYVVLGIGRTRICLLSQTVSAAVNGLVIVTRIGSHRPITLNFICYAVVVATATTSFYQLLELRITLRRLARAEH